MQVTQTLAAQFGDASLPRGIRNNNPGNIDWNANNDWQGQCDRMAVPAGVRDSRFAQFFAAKYGIRAIMKLLQNYQKKYGLTSCRAIIGRWAPSNENDTAAYAKHVADQLGVSIDSFVDMNQEAVLIAFAKAIVAHENGKGFANYYENAVYETAFGLL